MHILKYVPFKHLSTLHSIKLVTCRYLKMLHANIKYVPFKHLSTLHSIK